MTILRDIPIQQYIVTGDELTLDIPETNLAGNWKQVVLTFTNNYVDETYPLTNDDLITISRLNLKKGVQELGFIEAPHYGGQFLHSRTGNPIPRAIFIGRPQEATGTIKVYGSIRMFADLEIGVSVDFF